MLLSDERQALIEEYRILNNTVWERGRAVWLVNSVLLPSSILIVLQATVYRTTIGNATSSVFSLISFLLVVYCLINLVLTNKVNKECWKRINQIEETLQIKGNRHIYYLVHTTGWHVIRRTMWQALLLTLTGLFFAISIWNLVA